METLYNIKDLEKYRQIVAKTDANKIYYRASGHIAGSRKV